MCRKPWDHARALPPNLSSDLLTHHCAWDTFPTVRNCHTRESYSAPPVRQTHQPQTPLTSTIRNSLTPLNLAAIHKRLARGARTESAIICAIGHSESPQGYLPALRPLLDADADSGHAFDWAVEWGNIEAARICLERGANPTDALQKQRFWDDNTAAALNAEEVEMVAKERVLAGRLPWRKISRDMQVFLILYARWVSISIARALK